MALLDGQGFYRPDE